MNELIALGGFAGGAIFVAVIREIVKRFFEYPNIDSAIAELNLTRTVNKAHKTIPVPDSLRKKLTENPTNQVSWDARFISEFDIELSILELIELEQMYYFEMGEITHIINELSDENIKEKVLELATNKPLLTTCKNALIVNKITSNDKYQSLEPVFDIVYQTRKKDGEDLEFIHLDFPSNPFPLVGSDNGRKHLNEKIMPLILSMAFCQIDDLKSILSNSKKYIEQTILELKSLREEFSKIKSESSYLTVKITLTNTGKQPVFVSSSCLLSIQNKTPVKLFLSDYDENASQQKYSTHIKDSARRLAEWSPTYVNELKEFEATLNILSISPNESITRTFVSKETVSDEIISATNALKTGFASCSLSFEQFASRKRRAIPVLGTYSKRVTSFQKLLGSS